jgi:N-acetylglutamate synthase-like GNAT family acetyltransferase
LPITLRAATAADQELITKLVRDAHLNTLRLAWPNFLIAERLEGEEAAPRVIALGQLRPHNDGIQELASLVVVAGERGNGVGSQLVNALIAKADRPLYLMCKGDKVAYYQRFNFVELTSAPAIPPSLRTLYRLARLIERVVAPFSQHPPHLAIMAHSSALGG